jgi:DNA-binding NtrC family response regulator
MTRVLIVDDDPVQLRLTAETASHAGFKPIAATGGVEALKALRSDPAIAAMILDLVMPDLDGMGVLEAMAREGISTPVIVQTASSSLETVVSAMRQGATDFFVKPVAPERLIVSLRNAVKLDELETIVRTDRSRRTGTFGIADIITRSPTMDRVRTLVTKAAKSQIPVLIEGESGVGKELVARAIQGMGERAGKTFVSVNCAAIPTNLVESTLFGHTKGAFPGALADHEGKVAQAHGGTLFLAELGELPLDTQGKMLRLLQQGEIEPMGSARTERVNVRVIAATSKRLLNLARAGVFREDLYYRLNVLPIYVPPLRDRLEDIAPLVSHFIARLSAEAGKRVVGISDPALELLARYSWPGNVRQLENAVYRAVALCASAYLDIADFPQIMRELEGRVAAARLTSDMNAPSGPVHIDDAIVAPRSLGERREAVPDRFLDASGDVAALSMVERELIAFALRHYGGHMSKVARALGIGRSTLYRKLREYGLDEVVDRDAA